MKLGKRSAQIVRYRKRKCFKFLICRLQFGGAVFDPLFKLFIQISESLFEALALDGVQNGPGQFIST